jgi:outer membrane protein assembly factor BamD (BamD/ComL family)
MEGRDMNLKFYRLLWGCFSLLFFSVASCSLNQALKKPEGEREFLQETSRLEKLSREHPETSVRAQSHLQLAFLYLNSRNPQLDYARALQEMEIYLSLYPDKAQTVDFQNWLAVLRKIDYLHRDRVQIGRESQALQVRIEKLQRNLEKVQEANKGLRDQVAKLRETFERLKSLDRQMEEKRSLVK